jgi:hypothetical protein
MGQLLDVLDGVGVENLSALLLWVGSRTRSRVRRAEAAHANLRLVGLIGTPVVRHKPVSALEAFWPSFRFALAFARAGPVSRLDSRLHRFAPQKEPI